ncbi:hypothetical protein SESBI_36888 [Sesbania bispinosa]|nr:hypothetical protein SESBI_36888 [Sesbania bispinosa]
MECNKDEATKAKEIAELKFIAKDTLSTKKLALKAQNLSPALEGIPQMISTLDVYISAENKINGEADWYEAWSLLSDKAKRAAYDEKRNGKARKGSTLFGGSAKTGANGSYNFTKTVPSSARTPKNTTAKENTSSSTHKSKPTFWTACHNFKMQYEYLRVYLNLKLLCPNCHQNQQKSSRQVPNKSKSNAGKNNMAAPNVRGGSYSKTESYNKTNFQWAPFSKTPGVSNVAQAANVVQQAYDKLEHTIAIDDADERRVGVVDLL